MRIGSWRYLHSDSGRLAAADRTVADVSRAYLVQAKRKVCRIGRLTGVESQCWPHLFISFQKDDRIAIAGSGHADIESSAAGAGDYPKVYGGACVAAVHGHCCYADRAGGDDDFAKNRRGAGSKCSVAAIDRRYGMRTGSKELLMNDWQAVQTDKKMVLGRYIVADPKICHGQPTFIGSRVMVWQVLRRLAKEQPWDEIASQWPGSVTTEAIAEAMDVARRAFEQEYHRQERLPA